MTTDITIRFAESDQDVIAIHGFLCVVAGPMLPGSIDAHDSSVEVWRVVNHECALMAIDNRSGLLVGTLGLVKGKFWWGKQEFLGNRWFFTLPDSHTAKPLLEEGVRFAKDLGLELHIYDETKGRLTILNKSPLRRDFNPVLARPTVEPEPTHPVHPTSQ
jgi:hypothetical protein